MLCDDCFWKVQCLTYDNLKPGVEIYKCVDEYGGIDYVSKNDIKI